MLPRLSRRSVTAIFGHIGGSRFRNLLAPISSFYLHNWVGEREKEQRWYSAKRFSWETQPPELKRILFGNQYASTEPPPCYSNFLWDNFGKYMKLMEDRENHKRIAGVLRFFSSQSDDDMISLDDYVENMLPEQKDIFYLNAAHSVISANNYMTPFLNRLVENNVEVLFLVNPIDEVAIQNLKSYKDKNFVDASKEVSEMVMKNLIGAASAEEKRKETLKQKFGPTCEFIKKCLGDQKVASVQISMKRRPSGPPCVFVTGRPFGWSANMERVMKKSQTVDHAELVKTRRVFEINPQHLIIRRLHDALEDKLDEKHARILFDVLHFTTLLALGVGDLTPVDSAENIQKVLGMLSNIVGFYVRSKNFS